MNLQPELTNLLQLAYSAEKAAAFAYQGHASSINNAEDIKAILQIEADEWEHRGEVLKIMKEHEIPLSKWYEIKYQIIGRTISYSCHVIGWFMPMYFAGRLESGNVEEYFRMKNFFNQKGITKHDAILIEMGLKEKEHEVFFLEKIRAHKLLPLFEKLFSWGANKSFNQVK